MSDLLISVKALEKLSERFGRTQLNFWSIKPKLRELQDEILTELVPVSQLRGLEAATSDVQFSTTSS
ncbi:hypothetical protein RchiOBHm_Chr4g0407421 [Rosa chinensis]|uniref:Uncharacterized protein n=1 Tax=Rosa chinensis TaxID=74649 RepID=A0A2P6QUJ8_ROSCH|nr:hypothetical protein RchiOBHm_Chr4g0407421 [Rosa chinensis]